MYTQSQSFMYIGFGLSFLFTCTLIGEGIYKMKKNEGGAMIFVLGIIFIIFLSVVFLYLFFNRAQ